VDLLISKKDKIVQVALKLFIEQGFNATTTKFKMGGTTFFSPLGVISTVSWSVELHKK
jgi:hypothetical protein